MYIYYLISSLPLPLTLPSFLPPIFFPAYIQCSVLPFPTLSSLLLPFYFTSFPLSPLTSLIFPLSLSPSLIPETLPGGGHRSLAGGRGGSGTHSADPAQAPTLGPRPACLPLLHSWSCLQVSRRTTLTSLKKMQTCTNKNINFVNSCCTHILVPLMQLFVYLLNLCV